MNALRAAARVYVATVVTRMNIGGVARHVRLVHERLDQSRFDKALLIGETSPEEGELPLNESDRLHRIEGLKRAIDPKQDLAVLRRLRRVFKQNSPTIVETHMAKAGALGRVAAWSARVPIVVHTYHGHVLSGYFSERASRGFTAMERWLAKRTDALIAISTQVRDDLLALGIGDPSQWHVIPVALDLSELVESDTLPTAARRALGLPVGVPTVGIVGRLVPIKDHETFLAAAARVAGTNPHVHFVVAGNGELRSVLERRAEELLPGKLTFLGWVSQLPSLYAALDVVVLTSRNEGTPFAVIEAAAAGRPVVATRVGGVPDAVEEQETGFLVEPGDARGVAARVAQLLDAPERARVMGAAGRNLVTRRFAADRAVEQLAALFVDLVERRSLERTRR